jgi:hypothetical protein
MLLPAQPLPHQKAAQFFSTWTGSNRYAMLYRIGAVKKPETGARKIQALSPCSNAVRPCTVGPDTTTSRRGRRINGKAVVVSRLVSQQRRSNHGPIDV